MSMRLHAQIQNNLKTIGERADICHISA
jgi:hypothetical protein